LSGARQKAPGQLVNQRGGRGRALVVRKKDGAKAPPAPRGLSAYGRKRWREFWKSDAAAAVSLESDGERIYRWIVAVEERERYWQIASGEPLVLTVRGLVKNPLWTVIRQLTDEIQRAEEHFGMTPLSRFRLQLNAAEAESSIDDLMRKLSRPRPDEGQPANIIDLDDYEVLE
jgi:P27 family predicted phage terminase small subunit